MSRERDTSTASQITTDADTIRSWGERHTLVPVRYERGDDRRLDVVSESEADDADYEELSWSEFESELGREDKVVVRHGDRPEDVDVVDRSQAVGRAPVGDQEIEEALLGGETVETEVTERRVVEHVVVEEATVQSEIVDREVLSTDIVDVELLTTEVDHATVTRTDPPDETPEAVQRFKPGTRTDEAFDVEIAINEGWSLTREVVERITIESRIVRSDVETEDTVESDTLRETVDLEGVTETVLEGELVASPEAATDAVEGGRVESRFREDDAIETHLVRRQTVDEEMSVRKEITGAVSDAETVSTDAISHMVVESEIRDADDYDLDLADIEVDRERPAASGAADTGEAAGTTGTEAESTGTEAADTETTETTASPETTVSPGPDDEGKTVVNANGDEIGMVNDVEGGRMYVDPHPSITDRIRTALGWGDHDEDTYPVESDDIARIEDDRVVLGVQRER